MKEFFKFLKEEPLVSLLLGVFVAAVIISVYLKFTNIDMTETRLFINYWPLFTIEFIVILSLYCLIKLKK